MPRFRGFTKQELMDVYRLMVSSRRLDDRMLTLLRQGKAFFHIGGSGHEAAQVAAAKAMQVGEDWYYPYYRDSAFCMGVGLTPREQLLSFLSRADDPNSGGRQMPSHFGNRKLNIVSQSSPTGTQYLQAVGSALSLKLSGEKGIVYVSSGEGTTSQGDFHEALNWSSREKLPLVFHIQNNRYAISVPIDDQVSGGSVYTMVAGYVNLARFHVDGTDFFETNLAFQKAVDRARKGKGPSIIVSDVVRLLSHSSSDDQKKYRSESDLEEDKKKDPILRFRSLCVAERVMTDSTLDEIEKQAFENVKEDAEWALLQAMPDPRTAMDYVYSSDNSFLSISVREPISKSEKIVMVDAINHALHEELANNEKMIVYGQDVEDAKGGVFTATKGLSKRFGKNRCFNSPLAESSIVGTAVGLAVIGLKPVVEIQFGDYVWTAMMQIRNEVATLRYRSNNAWSCPMVIRIPVGGYIHGGLCHSQSIDGYFLHLPGVRIAYPSNASDAKGLLKTACRMDDPVLFFEHKGLYRHPQAVSPEPDENYLLPFGKARLVEKGDDITIVTWGMMVYKTLEAIKQISSRRTINADIIDLRTLNPIDWETIENSVRKTNKVMIVHEDNLTGGPGAEIAAYVSDRLFNYLDGPVRRVASKDSPIAFSSVLEDQLLVQTEEIIEGCEELLEY